MLKQAGKSKTDTADLQLLQCVTVANTFAVELQIQQVDKLAKSKTDTADMQLLEEQQICGV